MRLSKIHIKVQGPNTYRKHGEGTFFVVYFPFERVGLCMYIRLDDAKSVSVGMVTTHVEK
jgi:hypothetical protein